MADLNSKRAEYSPPEAPFLVGAQRKYLRGLAHSLDPVVHVGRDGLTKGLVAALDEALLTHELIKVRMHQPEDKNVLAERVAAASQSYLCGLVGHMAILYRAHPKKPRIKLPPAPSAD